MGENMCKKSFWVKSMCKTGFWVKSLWVKSIGEHRDRWDAGFRSPLLRCFALLCHILLLRLWSAAFHGIHRSLRGGLRPFGHATAAVCAWHGSIALCDSSSSLRGGAWNGLDGWGRKRDGADGVDSGRRDGCISFKLLHIEVALKTLRAINNTVRSSDALRRAKLWWQSL